MKSAIPVIAVLFGILLTGSVVPSAFALLNYEYVIDFGRFGILHEGKFSHPQHIDEDDEGNLYVTDLGNKRIQKFDSEGNYLDQWGRSGKAQSEFHEPTGIAINQNLAYVVDRDLNRIQVFDLNGKYITEWGERGIKSGQFHLPSAITTGVNGTVYVADSGNQRIQIFTSDGEFISSIGTAGSQTTEFLHLSDVEVDSSGNVYGVDKGNGKIEKFDSEGNHLQTIKFDANNYVFSPIAMVVAPDESLFILNSHDNRIIHLDQDAHSTLMVHERLGPFGNFLSLGSDIVLSSSGHLYAVDSLGHKVFKFNTPFVQKQMPVSSSISEDSVEEITITESVESVESVESTTQESTKEAVETEDSSETINDACGQSLESYNVIMGTDQNDILEGTDSPDLIFALGGNDIVSGYGGNDCIFGGDGDDIIFGNEGSDGIFGDQGNDILKGSSGNDIIYGNYGIDSIDGGSDHDICVAADTTDQDQIANCES